MSITRKIKAAVPIFVINANAEEEKLLASLIANGIEEDFAWKLIEFLPLAFGRVLLKKWRVRTSDEYVRYTPSEEKIVENVRKKLGGEIVFSYAIFMGSEMSKRSLLSILGLSLKNEQFQTIAGLSVEVKAVRELIGRGSKPENLVLTPPYFQFRGEAKGTNAE
jgi:hypothetical protein